MISKCAALLALSFISMLFCFSLKLLVCCFSKLFLRFKCVSMTTTFWYRVIIKTFYKIHYRFYGIIKSADILKDTPLKNTPPSKLTFFDILLQESPRLRIPPLLKPPNRFEGGVSLTLVACKFRGAVGHEPMIFMLLGKRRIFRFPPSTVNPKIPKNPQGF